MGQLFNKLSKEDIEFLKDFITRQRAEIERLNKEVGYWEAETKEARADIDQAVAETIKEFAERLKAKAHGFLKEYNGVNLIEIDNVVKEMERERE